MQWIKVNIIFIMILLTFVGKGGERMLRRLFRDESGMGVVEVILIIVVLVGLVIIFQTNMKSIVASIFSTIQSNVGKIK